MSNILVSGLVNVETNVKVKSFPIPYFPINYPFFGVDTNVAGVAVNISSALQTLGDDIKISSIIGNDELALLVKEKLEKDNITQKYIYQNLKATPQTVVLYDNDGNRQIYCDLKDLQEAVYPKDMHDELLQNCNVAIVCNSNFCRPLLKCAKEKNITVACDVQVLSSVRGEYDKEFMEYADILFLSNANLPYAEKQFICDLKNTYSAKIVVIGMGKKGALMYVRSEDALYKVPAVTVGNIVNTVGAGDALFSSFVHYYCKNAPGNMSAIEALKRASVFASYKIAFTTASTGFAKEDEVEKMLQKVAFSIERCF